MQKNKIDNSTQIWFLFVFSGSHGFMQRPGQWVFGNKWFCTLFHSKGNCHVFETNSSIFCISIENTILYFILPYFQNTSGTTIQTNVSTPTLSNSSFIPLLHVNQTINLANLKRKLVWVCDDFVSHSEKHECTTFSVGRSSYSRGEARLTGCSFSGRQWRCRSLG